jgi:hypothetical protein
MQITLQVYLVSSQTCELDGACRRCPPPPLRRWNISGVGRERPEDQARTVRKSSDRKRKHFSLDFLAATKDCQPSKSENDV